MGKRSVSAGARAEKTKGRESVRAVKFYGKHLALAGLRIIGLAGIAERAEGSHAVWVPLLARYIPLGIISSLVPWWEWPTWSLASLGGLMWSSAFLTGVWRELRGIEDESDSAKEALRTYETDEVADAIEILSTWEIESDRWLLNGIEFLEAYAGSFALGITTETLLAMVNDQDKIPDNPLGYGDLLSFVMPFVALGVLDSEHLKDPASGFLIKLGRLGRQVILRRRQTVGRDAP